MKSWQYTLIKLTLLIGGISLIIGFSLVPLGFFPATQLSPQAQEVDLVYQRMLAAIYISVGGFMIMAAKSKTFDKWVPFLYFVIVSNYLHALVMTFDMLQGNPLGMSFMGGTVGLVIIATLLFITRKSWHS